MRLPNIKLSLYNTVSVLYSRIEPGKRNPTVLLFEKVALMTDTCPDCGAVLPEGETCQDIFGRFLVLEFQDVEYGAVHFLTVACFYIQHGRYSDAGLTWIEDKLRAYLIDGVSPGDIRRQANKDADQSVRRWKVNRQPEEAPLPKIPWSMTIADVDARYQDAVSYRQLVTDWARVTLDEMKPWLKQE